MIRVVLPAHLRTLARVSQGEVAVDVPAPVTPNSVLEALESAYPMLKGTVRDHGTLKRRPFVRYFACGRDISFMGPDEELPETVANGEQPFMIVGAIAGG